MFLFDKLFGKKEAAPTTGLPATTPGAASARPQASAPGTGIRHDPRLIEALKEDHRLLLDIYTAIDAARRTEDLLSVQTRLGQFRMVLQDHLLKENVRLYVYLEHVLRGDSVSHELMHEFRHEMDGIGRVVVGFLSKYREIGIHPELAAEFATDFAAIGQALVARIRREEDTLYPMYAPLA
ncbi:hemerythrin domain-containing protein [Sulfurisoma sediminicola]|uniref:Hemerythrin HHE cation binding domain-containing protein n=1 Tax=Sulfurisoma sediminicola TaxID=1381557 RepID=A0A497XIX6_9PROT|nr:hemerythrin domain-containing protein [Sulfurisoma sediminicola]RLJ67853.1 hemerythrin HHE cation binding domain-containing protein [Sulfurisoma sediminicola]